MINTNFFLHSTTSKTARAFSAASSRSTAFSSTDCGTSTPPRSRASRRSRETLSTPRPRLLRSWELTPRLVKRTSSTTERWSLFFPIFVFLSRGVLWRRSRSRSSSGNQLSRGGVSQSRRASSSRFFPPPPTLKTTFESFVSPLPSSLCVPKSTANIARRARETRGKL
jgi:hypothetical protein